MRTEKISITIQGFDRDIVRIDDCETSCETQCAFKFNVDKLYNTICKLPNTDEVTLLLYMLLHRNPNVKQFIMNRPDVQLLVC